MRIFLCCFSYFFFKCENSKDKKKVTKIRTFTQFTKHKIINIRTLRNINTNFCSKNIVNKKMKINTSKQYANTVLGNISFHSAISKLNK